MSDIGEEGCSVKEVEVGWGAMLVRGCAGGELRHSLAERTKALAARCHALRSPARADRADRSAERRRPRHRKSQTRWYVKVSWAPTIQVHENLFF